MFDSDFSVGRILPNGGPCRSPPQALPVADPAPQRHRPPDPLGGRPRHGAPEGGRRVPGQPHHPRLRCAGGVIHPRARPPWVAGCSIWLQTDFYGRNVLQKFKKLSCRFSISGTSDRFVIGGHSMFHFCQSCFCFHSPMLRFYNILPIAGDFSIKRTSDWITVLIHLCLVR